MRNRALNALALLTLIAMAVTGCDKVQKIVKGKAEVLGKPGVAGKTHSTSTSAPLPDARSGDTIRIASFNIQVLGQSKIRKPEVMDILARVVRRFDIVAVQELRSKADDVIPRFLELINAEGGHYRSIVGPRLGRTSSKEQYVYLYDASRIEVIEGSVYTVEDPADLMHREPLVASFRVRGPESQQAFTFKLVNIHTDPDETDQELDALGDVFARVQRDPDGEDDVILLGDLNVSYKKLGKLGRLPGIAWVIHGQPTNTRGSKSYDNLVYDQRRTIEITGRGGVVDLMAEFGLTQTQALRVSDHLPVWAEFVVYEDQPGQSLASKPGARR